MLFMVRKSPWSSTHAVTSLLRVHPTQWAPLPVFFTQLRLFYCFMDKAWIVINTDSVRVMWARRRHKMYRNCGQLWNEAAVIKTLPATPLLLILKQKHSQYRLRASCDKHILGYQCLPAGHKSLGNAFHLDHQPFTSTGLTAGTAHLRGFHQRYWLGGLITRELRGKLELCNLS